MEMDNAASGVAARAPGFLGAPNAGIAGNTSPALVTIGGAGASIRSDEGAPGEPLRKRARTEGSAMASDQDRDGLCSDNFVEGSSEGAGATKDEKYYFEGGDCVIQVQNTLFKVHRFLLARDASAFEHMFSLPGHEDERNTTWSEGSSDERPIILHGESAANFRALLSMMYALPAELHVYTTPHAHIPTLLTIAQTTNKYHFATTEQWAISALYAVLTSKTPPHRHYDLAHCKSTLLRRVVEVALLCQHEELRDFAIGQWIQRIIAREVSPLDAMNVADEFNLVKLKGISYYAMLMACDDRLQFDAASLKTNSGDSDVELLSQDEDASPTPSPRTPPSLTPTQKARLLSGHYALTQLWCRVARSAPTFEKPPGCTYHAHGCLSTWRAVWLGTVRSEQTARYAAGDVVGRLRCVDAQLVADADLQCALTPACRRAAMESVRALCKEVSDGLASHFTDLTR